MGGRDDNSNPWLSIPAADYEGHMKSPRVLQQQFLSAVFRWILERFRPRSVAVLGCATGNGFEHIDPRVTRTVVGIDINPEYIALLQSRFAAGLPGLRLLCSDIADCDLEPRSLDLVHCALVLEYVDPQIAVVKSASWLRAGGVLSVVLQLASPGHEKVTVTEFKGVACLDAAMHLVEPGDMDRIAGKAGLRVDGSRVETLASGKEFYVATYKRVGDAGLDANS